MYEPPDEVTTFIADYMNEAHGDALVQIANAHGLVAKEAQLVSITGTGFTLRVRSDRGAEDLRVNWPTPLHRREDIRRHLLQMQEDARFNGMD